MKTALIYDSINGTIAPSDRVFQDYNRHLMHNDGDKMTIFQDDNWIQFGYRHICITFCNIEEHTIVVSIHFTEYQSKYFNNTIASIDIDNVKKVFNELVEFYNYFMKIITDFGSLQMENNNLPDNNLIVDYPDNRIRIGNKLIKVQIVWYDGKLFTNLCFYIALYKDHYFTNLANELISPDINNKPTEEAINILYKSMNCFINYLNHAINNYKRITTKSANN